ncbi:MAG: folate-binding protein YgfZ [Myxococcales bacterium]|nr:folate-binding protein YgfZ [Myxococcales bacterium]
MAAPAAQSVEYRAAREGAALWDTSARDALRVTGDDRVSFLHGMVTNDVEGLAPGASCYAAMLTAKGAMVGDLRLLRREADLVLDTGAGRGPAVKDFLNKYLISEDAEVHDAPELAALAVVGPRAEEVVARLPKDAVLGRLVSLLSGVDVLVPKARVAELLAAAPDVPRLSAQTVEVLRVEAGVPVFGVDMTESTIPLEANLERALHFQKGCYIGQEVIARATYRGQMNKKLMGLLLGDASPAPGAELRQGERKVGWLTTVVRSEAKGQTAALGYVHRDFLAPGTELDVATGGKAVVASLPL